MEIATITTEADNSLLAGVRSALDGADSALLTVAFVQAAGVHLLEPQLKRLGPRTRLLFTTTFGDLKESHALNTLGSYGADIRVLNPGRGTFHPKVYLARHGAASSAVIGSPNLTRGLVTNVEAAIMLRGAMSDPPIRAAWDFAEKLWTDPRCAPWRPDSAPTAEEPFDPELYQLLTKTIVDNKYLFKTLAHRKTNRVTQITRTGIYVETDASKTKGNKPELIPAWMFELAWGYLRKHGRLSNRYLLANDGLNIKRSSGVIAIMARMPGVEAEYQKTSGITLKMIEPSMPRDPEQGT